MAESWLDRLYWNCASEIGRRLYTMLTENPHEWKNRGGWDLIHSSGELSISISCKAWGMRVRCGRHNEERGLSFNDRHLIWRAVKRMGVKSHEQIEHERSLADLIEVQTCGKIDRPPLPPSKNS